MLSDFLCFVMYDIFGYRKKVVRKNLMLVFPEKDNKWYKKIERRFYHHMCDIMLETIKSFKISEEEMKKRFKIKNIEALKQFEEKDRSVIVMCGHYASWEWMMSLGYHLKHKGHGIYTPLINEHFDRFVKRIRKRHNAYVISRYEALDTIRNHDKNNERGIYGFASDQSPQPKPKSYWRKFLGVKVPVFLGAELLARELNFAIVFAEINRVKRGHYEAEFKVLTENPKATKPNEITDLFTDWVEAQVYSDPSQYLWSHNRFKHSHLAPKD